MKIQEKNFFAPIALFAFNRPNHLAKALSALSLSKGAENSILFVFIDGARNYQDKLQIERCQNIVNYFSHNFKSVKVRKNTTNLGLAKSIISGVSEVLDKYNEIIVLEDDLIVSEFFLSFMNEGLTELEHKKQVASIHGYLLPIKKPLRSSFYLRGADCWGWATWADRWHDMCTDGVFLLKQLKSKNLVNEFDLFGSYPFTQMLEDQISGKNDSWAIRWHASNFVLNKLTLYPSKSLVKNIGFDGSGTHTGSSSIFDTELANYCPTIPQANIFQDDKALDLIRNWYDTVYFSRRIRYIEVLKLKSIYKIYQSIIHFFNKYFKKSN
jgi:hypothetical protein